MTFSREIDRTVRVTLTTAEIEKGCWTSLRENKRIFKIVDCFNTFSIDGMPTVENEDYTVWRFIGGFNEDFMKTVLKRMGII